ncbi:MAG: thiol:disulfide interchange protein DsbA/DsbL [Paludibacterium sp.]|uniref:thiol:disulfide interchange protein DsbA/DsbL n=1 Tax=Paludibacterium sp. TaxID=1917523 RepID=UPI0025E63687|nr:thiol:disulfide interchange protein DsbA/DsbL [Paludibacterium sp.]MBV8048456.1 thiol:disulfide interchange protein DsbA/DsbL [Paludibacterium sp.]MBV8647387.1 thiol:disulfide interchange protein DsbA/DsbL [Paludibacterium sp.]
MKKWLFAVLLTIAGFAHAALVEGDGKDFTRLPVPQPVANAKKVEVIEFFSYTCIHCYDLDVGLSNWVKTKPSYVDFKRVQIVWGPQFEPFAKLFATMNALNLTEKLHHPVFVAMVEKHVNLGDKDQLAAWLKTQPGVDVNRFMQTYNSFGINAQVASATQQTRAYAIQGTPTLVINGKFALQPVKPDLLLHNLSEMVAEVHSGKLK